MKDLLDPRRIVRMILIFIIFTLVANLTLWAVLIVGAHSVVNENVRMLAYPVSTEGCLPEGVVVSYMVFDDSVGGMTEIRRELNLRTQYTLTFQQVAARRDNFLGRFMTYPDDCIVVTNLDPNGETNFDPTGAVVAGQPAFGLDAFDYAHAVRRGQPVRVTVNAVLQLPMMFYIDWQGVNEPHRFYTVSKSIVILSERYIRDVE